MPVALAEFADNGQYFLLQSRSGRQAVFLKQMKQAPIAELFARGVASFRHSVRKEYDAIAGCKLRRSRGKCLMGKNAEHSAARLQPLIRSIAVQENGRIVPRVRILQKPRRSIELRVEKCDEAVVAGIVADERIQPGAQTVGRQ